MAELARVLARFALGAVPDAGAGAVMKLSILDWAAVGLAGAAQPVARIVRDQALAEGGAGQAGLIGDAARVPARAAALVNGATSHALDYDDTHFAHIGHLSVAVVPAALALAELTGADAAAFESACLVGAEGALRVGVWLGRGHYQIGFHQTATAGAFGATLAAGRLLGLSGAQMEMALGLVATRASGLKSQFGTMGKPLNAGLAAQNGVEAAQWAARGLTSHPAALGGPQGFGPTHHGAGEMSAFDGLGQSWRFPAVHHKFHACCHGLHAALEAIAALPSGVSDAEIAGITVFTHPRWLDVCNIAAPRSGLEAKFSYRAALAMRLCGHDTARLESFSDAVCHAPRVRALGERITARGEAGLGEMQARLDVRLAGGARLELFHDLDAGQGLEARRARVRAKAAALLGAARAERLWEMIRDGADPARLAAELAVQSASSSKASA